jgi:hypothetical protein
MHTGLERFLRELRQEQAHADGGGLRQGKGEGLVRAGPAGSEKIEAVEALVGRAGRTDAALVPAMAGPPFLPDPGLILAPEPDPGAWMRCGDLLQLRPKPIF